MDLIVMTEAAQGAGGLAAAQDLKALLERWNPLMTRLAPQWSLQDDADALNTLAERVQAQLVLGRPPSTADDGLLPLEAWACCAHDGPHGPALARLTPFHGLVGSDRITLVPPAELQLGEGESRQLFEAVQPLFASEGVGLEWCGPLQWRVQHESLRALPCASIARAEGDSVQRWQGRTPLAASRLLRRLQNEAQMVMHQHEVNRARTERGALSVNSLWLDHAGAAGQLKDEPPQQALVRAWGHIRTTALGQANSALQAWVDAALPSTGGEQNTHPREPVLVLCGRHAAQAFTMRRIPGGWRGAIERTLKRPPRTLPLETWLHRLDLQQEGSPD